MYKTLLILLIFLTGCATLPRASRDFSLVNAERDQRIYVASHGWHTGIILERGNLNPLIPSLAERFPAADYYEIGWGDSGFYQASKITTGITLNAVFLPSDAVVHLVGFEGDPIDHFNTSDVQDVFISTKGMKSLCAFIESSFARDKTGKPKKLSKGLYGDSQFYEGQGKYHLFNGCNKWTAKALYSGGVEIEPLFKISSSSVMNELEIVKSVKTRDLLRGGRGGPHRF
jgi:uncharacterized protein (TIGR02117 family)